LVLAVFGLTPASSADAQQAVGTVTAVQKEVSVVHPGQDKIFLVEAGDDVLFKDTYETKAKARAKLLFEDDSLVSLGENTKLQITENVYNPGKNMRAASMKVLSGRIRVLVGRVFSGTGSKFEVHTPTAVAAARGTYYIVWLYEQDGKPATGVVNLGGVVGTRSSDPKIPGEVVLDQEREYTLIEEGRPPISVDLMEESFLRDLLAMTEVKDQPKERAPSRQVLGLERVVPVTPIETMNFAAGETGVPSTQPLPEQLPPTTPVRIEIQFPN
jgi:co-chaperonin GroES (HSP10)